MNTLARTARRNATSILCTRSPTTTVSIARKSTLTQVFSDKASRRNALPTLLDQSAPVPACLLTHVAATGPHSQAIKANGFVFLSAQTPADGESKLISGGVKAQAEKMVENTREVLEQAGSGLESVVKVNVSIEHKSMGSDITVVGQGFPYGGGN
jgi:enamine deaminase RidA (YjgF/YER057c/UK114 family)